MHYFFCKKEIIKNLNLNISCSFAKLGKAYRLRLWMIEYPARDLETGVLRAAPLVAAGVLLVLVGTTFTHLAARVVLLVLIRNHVASFQAATFCSTASDFFILKPIPRKSFITNKGYDFLFQSEKLHLTFRQKRNLLYINDAMRNLL